MSSISFKLNKEEKINVLKVDDKVFAEQVDLESEIEVEIKETRFFSIFNQESTIITKIKYEKKDDFGMIELSKEQIEEQEKEELEMKALENLERDIKNENEA